MNKIVLSTVFLLATVIVSAEEQVSAPVFEDGDSWIFEVAEKNVPVSSTVSYNGTFKVVYHRGKLRIFDLTTGQEEKRVGHNRHFGELLGLHKQVANLNFPMYIGLKWDNDYLHRIRSAKRAAWQHEKYSVIGLEDVTVRAGTFRAFKIYKYMTGPNNRHETTYFYSPDTKCIVKSTFLGIGPQMTREIELIRFEPSDPKKRKSTGRQKSETSDEPVQPK